MGGSTSQGEANMFTPPLTTLRELAVALDIPSSAWRIDQENHCVLVHLGQLGGKPGMTLVFELVDDEEGTWHHQIYQVVRFDGDLSDIENWFEEPHGSKVISPWETVLLTAEKAKEILDAATRLSKDKAATRRKGIDPLPSPTQEQLAQMYAELADHIRAVGPVKATQLDDYERKHWLTKYRPEKRHEPNRLFHFIYRSPLVRTYGVTNHKEGERWGPGHFTSTMVRVVGQQPTAPPGAWLTGMFELDHPVPEDRGKSLPETVESEPPKPSRFTVTALSKSEARKKSSSSKKSGASKKSASKKSGAGKKSASKKSGASKKSAAEAKPKADPGSKDELDKLERSLGLGRKRR